MQSRLVIASATRAPAGAKELIIDTELFAQQKSWLYSERELMPRASADSETNERDADTLDGLIELLERISDFIEEGR